MNDLSAAAAAATEADDRRRCCDPIPSPVPCLLLLLFLPAFAVSAFILVAVRNAFTLASVFLLSVLVLSFVVWNVYKLRSNGTLLLFLNRTPTTDLLTAKDGQIVKITGCASCADLALESSYEKIERCIYSSTLLYEYKGFGSKMSSAYNLRFWRNLIYVERCIADFYITDIRSGARVLVKVSSDSKINPLVTESLIVKTSSRKKELSSTLKKWLEERHLSSESRLLCLKEGYIMEGSYLTVMGMLIRKSGVLTIVPPPEPISTGCLLGRFLLPIDVNGLILRYLYRDDSSLSSSVSNQGN